MKGDNKMNANITKFIDYLKENPEKKEQLMEALKNLPRDVTEETVLNDILAPAAKEAGTDLTLDDVKEFVKTSETVPLTEEQMEEVSGGFVLAAFIVAGIGGAIAGAIAYYEMKR